MSLTDTEKYMLAGAGGLIAERLSDAAIRKTLTMPLWAFTAISLGIYFGTHAVGTTVSHMIDPQHGAKRFRETSNELYQLLNVPRHITDTQASRTDRHILVTKLGIILSALARGGVERPEHFNDPTQLYLLD